MSILVLVLCTALAWAPTPAPLAQGASGPPTTAASPSASPPPIPFSSNGCSGFREAMFFSCCFVHDFDYWSGGTWKNRRQADNRLRHCLMDVSHNWGIAYVGYTIVRLGTVTGALARFGWGRGWRRSERSLYAALTPDQQRQIAAERQRVCSSLSLDPQTGRYRVGPFTQADALHQLRPNQARQFCGSALPAPLPGHSATSR